jgi:hypothetical protein
VDDVCDGLLDEDVCPCQWVAHGGRSYLFCTDGKAWDVARRTCASHGAHLASSVGRDENTWLYDTTGAIAPSGAWWLGGTDNGHESLRVWEN